MFFMPTDNPARIAHNDGVKAVLEALVDKIIADGYHATVDNGEQVTLTHDRDRALSELCETDCDVLDACGPGREVIASLVIIYGVDELDELIANDDGGTYATELSTLAKRVAENHMAKS